MPYHHTQIAFITLAGTIAAGLVCIVGAALLRRPAARWPLGIVAAILLAVAVIFSTLTVDVGENEVSWYFGPGFWSYRLDRADVQGVAIVRNPWQYGWGIRIGPGFRLYNVQGLDAVQIRLKGGQFRRIGTDDPQGLAAALKR